MPCGLLPELDSPVATQLLNYPADAPVVKCKVLELIGDLQGKKNEDSLEIITKCFKAPISKTDWYKLDLLF